MKLRLQFLLTLLVVVSGLYAQSPFWHQLRLTPELQEAELEDVFEDKDGLLWFPTSAGLVGFDGLEFQVYPRAKNNPGYARSIFQDQLGQLWIGYQDGDIQRLVGGELEAWEPEEGLPTVPITGFAEDKKGQLWIATYGEGVYVLADHHLYNINTDDGLPANDVYTITLCAGGDVWLGTDGGITRCVFNNGDKELETLDAEDGLPDDIVRVLLPTADGGLWIGTYDRGISYYDLGEKTFSSPVPDWDLGVVSDLTQQGTQELFIGTEDKGGWSLSLENGNLQPMDQGAFDNLRNYSSKVYALHQDRNGNLWMATSQEGIRHTDRRFLYLQDDKHSIQALLASDAGKPLWVGTDVGLFQLEGSGQFRPWPGAEGLNVVSLYEDDYSNLWVGTFGDGVYLIEPVEGRQRHLSKVEGLLNGSILSIDGSGEKVWLASLGGVVETALKGNPFNSQITFNKVEGLKTDFIYQVLADGADRAWFGTDGEGLSLLDNGQITTFRSIVTSGGDSVDLRTVYSITRSDNGHLWLSTARAGLFEFDGTDFHRHQLVADGPGTEFTSLATNAEGGLLMAHANGVAVLDPVADRYANYTSEEVGMKSFIPNLNTITSDGQNTWIGGENGLLRHRVLEGEQGHQPRTLLRAVTVYPDKKPRLEGSTFAHDENFLVFDFLGLWYANPESVRYRYQLIGYDPDWIETRDQRAIYSRLPAGTFTFKVESTIGANWEGADNATYVFTILQPLWKRWWFVLLAGLLVAGGLFFTIRKREQRLKRVNLLQKQQVESQYEALKSQINPHFLFNSFNTLIAMIEETPEDAVVYTEKLSDLFRSVLQYRDRESIPISEELELLDNYAFLLNKRFGDKMSLHIGVPPEDIRIVPLSLQLLVENAVKHNVVSTDKPLHVDVFFDQKNGWVGVSNLLQPKLRKEKSTGFGLQSLADRYAMLTPRKIKIEEKEGRYLVCLPTLKKANYENPDH